MAHQKQIISGVFWNALQIIVNQGFSFIIRLVLAKLLFPEQFGVIGMATVVTGLVQVLNDLGIGAALVQRKKEDLNESHYHTAFWTGMGWSLLLFLIIVFIGTPLAAVFYKEPILNSLIPVLSLGILFGPMNLVNKAQLTKNMNFKKMAQIDTISSIVAGVGSIILAFTGAGVWALAFNSLGAIIIAVPFYFFATSWYPAFRWSRDAFNDVFGFGIYTTGTNVVNYMISNVDYLLIGKLLSAQILGVYTLAFILTDTFRTRLMAVVNNVMYPMYGKKQDDPVTIKRFYLKVVKYNCAIIYPIMVSFIVLGEPIILQFFGEKWIDSIVPLQILSLSVMVHMLVNSNTALIRGLGKPRLEMNLQIFKAVIFIPTLIFGILNYGIIGASWAILLNKVIAVIVAQFTFNYFLNIKISAAEFILSVKEPWIASILAFTVAYILYNTFKLNFFIVEFFLLATYAVSIWWLMGKEVKEMIGQYKLQKSNT